MVHLMSDSTVTGPSDSALACTVTVVVPTRNAQRTLGACLKSLRNQSYPCRTVVVDNGSTDGTVSIAEHGADVVLHAGPERSAQRNVGARAFPADVVGFVDADMILDPTVVEEAVAALRDGAGSVIVPERTIGSGFWVEVRAFERSFYDGSDAIEAARFFRWDIFEHTGGFDEQLTGAEDWDLSDSARRLAPVTRTVAGIQHDEGTIGYLEACRKKAYYAEGVRRYVAKRGMSVVRQAGRRPWMQHPSQLVNRHGAGLVALKAGEATAVTLALGSASVRRAAGRSGRRAAAEPTSRLATTMPADGKMYQMQRLRRLWHAAKYSIRICQTMQNGGRTLAQLAIGFIAPDHAGDVTFVDMQGMSLEAPSRDVPPSRDYAWWPIVEVVLDDCYRLSELAADLRATTCRIVDIGAHVGSFTVAFATAVPGAQVTAFEPSADRAGYLRRNVDRNGLGDRVAVVQAAVGGQAERKMLIGGELAATSTEADGELVDVMSFADVLNSIDGPIDLLKMDCEGGEYDIIASASSAMLYRIQRLVLEYHPAPTERVEQLFATIAHAGLVERWRQETVPGQLGVASFAREIV